MMRWMTIWALALGLALPLVAQDRPAGTIRVTGHGEVAVAGKTLVVKAQLEASAELAVDALKKHSDLRRRLEKKLEELEIEGIAIRGEGFKITVGQQGGRDGFVVMNGRRATPEVEVNASEMLVVTLDGLDERDAQESGALVGDIVDVLKAGGARLGPVQNGRVYSSRPRRLDATQPGVYFRPADRKKLETEAYRVALADARDRAERLAELAGVKLGGVTSIVAVTGEPPSFVEARSGQHEVDLQVTYGIEAH